MPEAAAPAASASLTGEIREAQIAERRDSLAVARVSTWRRLDD
jgi:hypothetical protein